MWAAASASHQAPHNAKCPWVYFFCYLDWSLLGWSSNDIFRLHINRESRNIWWLYLKSLRTWKSYLWWEWVLPNAISVTKTQTGTPVSADVFQRSISISARILTPNYLLIVIFNNLTDFNVKWPDSLPGTKSLAKCCGSPYYFEITPQIQSKAEAGLTPYFSHILCIPRIEGNPHFCLFVKKTEMKAK